MAMDDTLVNLFKLHDVLINWYNYRKSKIWVTVLFLFFALKSSGGQLPPPPPLRTALYVGIFMLCILYIYDVCSYLIFDLHK